MKIGLLETITMKKHFLEIRKSGRYLNLAPFCYKYVPSEKSRVGFVIKKGLGNAVVRNKIKRRLKEAIRKINNARTNNGIIIARYLALDYPFVRLCDDVEKILGQKAFKNHD